MWVIIMLLKVRECLWVMRFSVEGRVKIMRDFEKDISFERLMWKGEILKDGIFFEMYCFVIFI